MITIDGYTVGKAIGRGGMSVVYEAVHDMLKTHHAVKVLDVPPESENGKTLAAKVLAEARILAALRHPGIVRVTDFGTLPDGRDYFVMDRIEGGSLAERLATGKPPRRRPHLVCRTVCRSCALPPTRNRPWGHQT